jgi:hypothetical protein
MSYVHCPTCKRAYNIAVSAQCPACPVPAELVDPAEDIVAAAEQLARAMARATPDQRDEAMTRLDHIALPHLALPAPDARPVTFHGATLRSIREALVPTVQQPLPRPQPLLATLAYAVVERAAERLRKVPFLTDGLRRARARVRALAA